MSGYDPVKRFLIEESYLELFNEEELESLGGKKLRNQVNNDYDFENE